MRPANSARRSPAEASPRHWTRTCSGSMNSGRAINVTRGARMISIWCQVSGVGCRVPGGSSQLQLRRRPAGGAFDLAQAGGDVVGHRGSVRTDLQFGERRPIGRGDYNTGIEDRARVVDTLQVAAQRDHFGPVDALQYPRAQPAVAVLA